MSERECTCHPDDSPPRPCKKQFALTECRLSAAQARIAVLEEDLRNANIRAWRLANEINNDELKIADKHCDWPAFKHAFNGIMKARRAALKGGENV